MNTYSPRRETRAGKVAINTGEHCGMDAYRMNGIKMKDNRLICLFGRDGS